MLSTRSHDNGLKKYMRLLVTKLLYISQTPVSLLSCSQFDRTRITVEFENRKCIMVDRNGRDQVIKIESSSKRDELYTLHARGHQQDNLVFATVKTRSKLESLELGHRRLDQTDKATVRNMNENVERMDINLSPLRKHFESCLGAGQTKTAFVGRLIKCEKDHFIQ